MSPNLIHLKSNLASQPLTVSDMALFKVTTKRLLHSKGQRHEAGMTAEVSFNGSVLPLVSSAVKAEIIRQFKMKYNIDFVSGNINSANLEVTKL